MYQPWIAREDAAAAAHVGPHVRLGPGAGTVGEIVALAMDAVERVGRARQADRVDVLELQLARGEGLPRRDPGELLAGLLRAADEARHPGADDGDARAHRRITATAADVRGNPAPGLRHGPPGRRPVAEPLDAREGAGETVRLPEVSLAERAAARVHPIGGQLREPERLEVLELLVGERVVDLGQLHVDRARPRRDRSAARAARSAAAA